MLEEEYNIPEKKVIAVPHPFCRRELPDLGQLIENKMKSPDERLSIGFLGNLFKPPKVPGHRVVKAIEDANKMGANIALHIFGDMSDSAKIAAEQSEDNMVVLHPRVSHEESLRGISSCDFFLITLADIPNCQCIMHSKLPHYLLLNRPILGMVPDNSAVAEIIRETGTGFIIGTTENWGDALNRIVKNYREDKSRPVRDEAEVEKYSWHENSKQWLSIIGANE